MLSRYSRKYQEYFAISEDFATISFLNWFLDEQVEEESMFETHIDYLERIQEDNNALFIYEKDLASRHFDEDAE